MIPRRLALLVLAACAGCARPSAPPTVADVAGCYVLEWHHGDTVYAGVGLPDSVRLDSARIPPTEHREIAFAGSAVVSDTLGPGDTLPWYRYYYASHWEMGSGDSIQIVFNENWTRYETTLPVRGNRLEGSAVFRSDDEPKVPPVVSVRGRRFPCPAAP